MSNNHDANIAILSADFHTHENYQKFYETFCDDIRGCVGTYSIVIQMADIMTYWESKNPNPWENYDWIALSENFTDTFIKNSLARGEIVDKKTAFKFALKFAKHKPVKKPRQRWQVETLFSHGWENVWREDLGENAGILTTYATRKEARDALREHIADTEYAFRKKYLASPALRSEFRISKVKP